jgi:hypothetical protein
MIHMSYEIDVDDDKYLYEMLIWLHLHAYHKLQTYDSNHFEHG